MEREYENGIKKISKYCLKLKDSISLAIKIINCNQFKLRK